MELSIGEKIKIIMKRKGINITQLAELTGQSRQNLTNKLQRDNFQEQDARVIAKALGCTFEPVFKMTDTGDEI
ncbi:MAG: helix-turn-helix transcriptional regulator [Clostridia bacterium]|nr:helix-turn-helix transcriptional regulator [Clostridia bacterium]